MMLSKHLKAIGNFSLFHCRITFSLFIILLLFGSAVRAQNLVDLSINEPILAFQKFEQILSDDDYLSVDIYSDGHAILHFPSYFKKAGNYSVHIPDHKFKSMLARLNSRELINFNNVSISLEKNQADQLSGIVYHISDTSHSSFKIKRIDNFSQSRNIQEINYQNLQFDFEKYSSIQAIKKLAEIEVLLLNLINQNNVQKTSDD